MKTMPTSEKTNNATISNKEITASTELLEKKPDAKEAGRTNAKLG